MLGSTRNALVAYLALILAVSAVQASSEFQRVQRGHVNLKRIVKKRSPQFVPIPVIGAGQDPAENVPRSSSSPVASTTPTATTESATASSASPSSTTNLVSDVLSLTGALSASGSSSASLSASASASSTASLSSSAPTSSTSATSPPPTQQTQTPTFSPTTSAAPASKPTVTVVTTRKAAEQETEIPKPTGAAKVKSTTLMVLIIIASSIGGVAILWTIFRKWKLGRSSKFDERLQPIDWQPTDDRDDGIIPAHRRAPSNASSFHSASVHGHGNRGNSGGASNLQPIPDHDFTAGAAPIGGYADLARGPSPPMGEVNRGVPLGRGYEYDNGVPLHHQTGGAYNAYEYQGSRY